MSIGATEFAERKLAWECDQGAFPLFFLFTSQPSTIHISYRAVAPAFRKQGIMKGLSLGLLHLLYEEGVKGVSYVDRDVSAITMHPATHKFFNPGDKTCAWYESGELQVIKVSDLLRYHGCLKQELVVLSVMARLAAGGSLFWAPAPTTGSASMPVSTRRVVDSSDSYPDEESKNPEGEVEDGCAKDDSEKAGKTVCSKGLTLD